MTDESTPTEGVVEAEGDWSLSKFEPLTEEEINQRLDAYAFGADLGTVLATIKGELTEIAKLKLAARLLPAGGMKVHLGQIRGSIAQRQARIEILRKTWVELQAKQGLPIPPDLTVARTLPTRPTRRHQ